MATSVKLVVLLALIFTATLLSHGESKYAKNDAGGENGVVTRLEEMISAVLGRKGYSTSAIITAWDILKQPLGVSCRQYHCRDSNGCRNAGCESCVDGMCTSSDTCADIPCYGDADCRKVGCGPCDQTPRGSYCTI